MEGMDEKLFICHNTNIIAAIVWVCMYVCIFIFCYVTSSRRNNWTGLSEIWNEAGISN